MYLRGMIEIFVTLGTVRFRKDRNIKYYPAQVLPNVSAIRQIGRGVVATPPNQRFRHKRITYLMTWMMFSDVLVQPVIEGFGENQRSYAPKVAESFDRTLQIELQARI